VVAILEQCAWTNGKAQNHVSALHSLLMHFCPLETHIRISKTLKKFNDLMRKQRSDLEPRPCPLQAQASGPESQGISLWVALALRDSCKTR